MPDVFLSYAADDAHFAEKLAESLKEDGISVWLDKAEIKAGDNWVTAISNAVQNTSVFIPIISKYSSRSNYFSSEIAAAIAAKAQDSRKKIIPILIERNSKIPSFIDQYQYMDMSSGTDLKESASKLASIIKTPAEDVGPDISVSDIKAGSFLQIKKIEDQTRSFEIELGIKNLRVRVVGFLSLVAMMLGISVASILIFYDPGQETKYREIVTVLLSVSTGLIGSVLGFYFGSTTDKSNEKSSNGSPK